MTKTKAGLLAATTLLLAAPAFAEFAPSRPVEFIVASGAGGGTDNFARTIQAVLTRDDTPQGRKRVLTPTPVAVEAPDWNVCEPPPVWNRT